MTDLIMNVIVLCSLYVMSFMFELVIFVLCVCPFFCFFPSLCCTQVSLARLRLTEILINDDCINSFTKVDECNPATEEYKQPCGALVYKYYTKVDFPLHISSPH